MTIIIFSIKLNTHKKISNVCFTQSCGMQRIRYQPAVIDSSCCCIIPIIVAEHAMEDFACSIYNNDRYCMLLAFTQYGHHIMSLIAWSLHAMANWPTVVSCYLEASNSILFLGLELTILYLQPLCNSSKTMHARVM